jgi:hypothetical protein
MLTTRGQRYQQCDTGDSETINRLRRLCEQIEEDQQRIARERASMCEWWSTTQGKMEQSSEGYNNNVEDCSEGQDAEPMGPPDQPVAANVAKTSTTNDEGNLVCKGHAQMGVQQTTVNSHVDAETTGRDEQLMYEARNQVMTEEWGNNQEPMGGNGVQQTPEEASKQGMGQVEGPQETKQQKWMCGKLMATAAAALITMVSEAYARVRGKNLQVVAIYSEWAECGQGTTQDDNKRGECRLPWRDKETKQQWMAFWLDHWGVQHWMGFWLAATLVGHWMDLWAAKRCIQQWVDFWMDHGAGIGRVCVL